MLVMEYCPRDLKGCLDRLPRGFLPVQVRSYMFQLLKGLQYLHNVLNVVHRDLKTANVLLTDQQVIKLADFGMATDLMSVRKTKRPLTTSQVCTLWYRPPEVLAGMPTYNTKVDMWGAGCIFAELLTGQVLFNFNDEASQYVAYCKALGGPEEVAPKIFESARTRGWVVRDLPARGNLEARFASRLNPDGLDLLRKLLHWDPAQRMGADEALRHPFFWRDGREALEPSTLPPLGFSDAHSRPVGDHKQKVLEQKAAMRQQKAAQAAASSAQSFNEPAGGDAAPGALSAATAASAPSTSVPPIVGVRRPRATAPTGPPAASASAAPAARASAASAAVPSHMLPVYAGVDDDDDDDDLMCMSARGRKRARVQPTATAAAPAPAAAQSPSGAPPADLQAAYAAGRMK